MFQNVNIDLKFAAILCATVLPPAAKNENKFKNIWERHWRLRVKKSEKD